MSFTVGGIGVFYPSLFLVRLWIIPLACIQEKKPAKINEKPFRYIGKKNTIVNAVNISFKEDSIKHYRLNGYKGIEKNWNNDFDKTKKELNKITIEVDQQTSNLFQTFLNECHNNNINVTLVATPEFIEGQHFVSNRESVIDTYKDFAKNQNLVFLDYSTDSICFNKAYFYNALHLNKSGAELFTRKLAHDLKKRIFKYLTHNGKNNTNTSN